MLLLLVQVLHPLHLLLLRPLRRPWFIIAAIAATENPFVKKFAFLNFKSSTPLKIMETLSTGTRNSTQPFRVSVT
jgi:hypothetical protein